MYENIYFCKGIAKKRDQRYRKFHIGKHDKNPLAAGL